MDVDFRVQKLPFWEVAGETKTHHVERQGKYSDGTSGVVKTIPNCSHSINTLSQLLSVNSMVNNTIDRKILGENCGIGAWVFFLA